MPGGVWILLRQNALPQAVTAVGIEALVAGVGAVVASVALSPAAPSLPETGVPQAIALVSSVGVNVTGESVQSSLVSGQPAGVAIGDSASPSLANITTSSGVPATASGAGAAVSVTSPVGSETGPLGYATSSLRGAPFGVEASVTGNPTGRIASACAGVSPEPVGIAATVARIAPIGPTVFEVGSPKSSVTLALSGIVSGESMGPGTLSIASGPTLVTGYGIEVSPVGGGSVVLSSSPYGASSFEASAFLTVATSAFAGIEARAFGSATSSVAALLLGIRDDIATGGAVAMQGTTPIVLRSIRSRASITPILMFRGTTKRFPLTAKDESGLPLDFTGGKLWLTAKKTPADADVDAIFSLTSDVNGGVLILDAKAGLAVATVQPSHTVALSNAVLWRLFYQWKFRSAEGDLGVLWAGMILVRPTITQTTT